MTAPVLNAVHVRCPGCGAPAGDPSLAVCAYCRTTLGRRACPTCHCRLAPGITFCPWCGTGVVTPDAAETALRCPCGDGALQQRVLFLAECVHCHGVWVNRDTIERMVASHADDALLLALAPGLAATKATRATSAGDLTVRYRPCPDCGTMMNRVNYARISGIIVDVCRDHGTWFDVHELPALLEFVRRGGLDTARAREAEALADERRRLERERLMRTQPEALRGDRYGVLSSREARTESVFSLLRELFTRG